ncbi:MAG: hypothetical protein LBU81_07835 [Methanosarcinales archaeon]|jgi:hypothetical protein|nr:hypothetical protein [Methanosarcinales archaeon]
MSYTILDLKSYLRYNSPESIVSDLSSFGPGKGCAELYLFLQESYDENGNRNDNFIDFERNNLCRVYFVLADKVENANGKCVLNLKSGMYPVYGYFSVAVKTLYKNNIHADQEILPRNNTNMYLIGHLCKNASYEWGKGGEYMLQQCFGIIESAYQKIGMGYILIECEPALVDYYSNRNFAEIGVNSKTGLYQMIYKVVEKFPDII